jgi:hypothetical protein
MYPAFNSHARSSLRPRIDVGAARKLRTPARSFGIFSRRERTSATSVARQNITRQVMATAESGETIDLTILFAVARMMGNWRPAGGLAWERTPPCKRRMPRTTGSHASLAWSVRILQHVTGMVKDGCGV